MMVMMMMMTTIVILINFTYLSGFLGAFKTSAVFGSEYRRFYTTSVKDDH